MDNDQEIPAQDTAAPDGQPEGVSDIDVPVENAPVVAEPAVNPGIQKRIDELTAQVHEARRKAETYQEQMLGVLAQQVAPVQQQVDTFEDVDPAVKRMMEAVTRGLKADSTRLQNQIASMAAASEAQREIQALGITDPKVAAMAVDYAAGFKANGLNISTKEATLFAIGKAVAEGTYVPGAPVVAAQARRGAAPITGGVRTPSLATRRQATQLPSNFGDLSPDEQLTLLEKNGVGDQTF